MILKCILLVVGFVLLVKGADYFVEGSSDVARRLRIPSIIIGMTIVAMGTSLPELAVSISAAIAGSNEMAYSNVVGSNLFNLLVVCGAAALFTPLTIHTKTLKREFPFSIVITVLLLIFGYFGMSVGHLDGLIYVVIFIIFIIMMVKSAMNERKAAEVIKIETDKQQEMKEKKPLPIWKVLIYIVAGAIAVAIGGQLVVDSAEGIAQFFGLSDTLIGLTIVAFGTSLPELVTGIAAARKGEVDMALGNVIGSNIFNILFVLGLAASISGVEVVQNNLIDCVILIILSVLVWIFCITRKKISRLEGLIMVVIYGVYVVYICIRA
ncbi:calcium/sodium antiporter [Eubacterium oxidoreducens]|uniref:Cation:H+ antiporter n=1 Tax=Eubacterium oxidoreducens TaxID=1732 RepID=A0A1G6CRS7_EUBOX|nr:calcium/sodium antiporter [Eubacterium oxidoreducens]SDB35475.1 cation:H+ antiporter [Eubacterium oxidoreducens]